MLVVAIMTTINLSGASAAFAADVEGVAPSAVGASVTTPTLAEVAAGDVGRGWWACAGCLAVAVGGAVLGGPVAVIAFCAVNEVACAMCVLACAYAL